MCFLTDPPPLPLPFFDSNPSIDEVFNAPNFVASGSFVDAPFGDDDTFVPFSQPQVVSVNTIIDTPETFRQGDGQTR